MPKKDKSRRLALYALLVLVAAFLHLSGWLTPVYDPISGLLLRLAAPFHAAGAGAQRFLEGSSADVDGAEPQALIEAIDNLKIDNAKLLALAAENESLKAALAFRERGEDVTVAARVIYESAKDDSRLLILDKGEVDGVRPGQPVVTGNGVIAGKIFAVRRRTSSVMLLTDSRSRLAVTVQNAQDTLGVLEGDRGLSMAITLIPQIETVAPGDTVITSGLEPGIRRGLVVGVIDKVDKSTQDPFQSAGVAPFSSSLHPLIVQVVMTSETD